MIISNPARVRGACHSLPPSSVPSLLLSPPTAVFPRKVLSDMRVTDEERAHAHGKPGGTLDSADRANLLGALLDPSP